MKAGEADTAIVDVNLEAALALVGALTRRRALGAGRRLLAIGVGAQLDAFLLADLFRRQH
jgi:hypothetical protein